MTLLVSDVAQDVFAYIGRPPQSRLPFRDLIDVGSRKITSIILDIFNTDRDYRVTSIPLSLTDRDSIFPYEGEIARLESRPIGSTSDDDWEIWEKVSYGAWDGEFNDWSSVRQFAVYSGAGTHLVTSENPSIYEFRVLVEQGTVRLKDLTDNTTLSTLVQPLLFTRWALEAGAMVDDDSDHFTKLWDRKERHLRLELPRLEKQWQKYLEGGRGEEVSIREPFNSRRDFDSDYYMDGTGRFRST
jgi:hypothetical protein